MNELISVVLPTYNRESTIERAIDSVLKQTYSNIELIIVDDGSTDRTKNIVGSIKDKRIKYIWQTNQGACAARNRGILEAIGEYIAFQDSDDEWCPEKLEKQIHYLKEMNADIVFHAFWREGLEEEREHVPDVSIPSKQVYLDDIVPVNMISTQTLFGKKSCFSYESFNIDYKRFQDWELGIRLVKKYKVFYDCATLANVYVSEDSISKKPELALHSIFGIFHNTVGSYREIIQEKDCRIKELEDLVQEANQRRSLMQLLLDDYKRQIDEYRLSTSWKVTALFRKVANVVRRVVNK